MEKEVQEEKWFKHVDFLTLSCSIFNGMKYWKWVKNMVFWTFFVFLIFCVDFVFLYEVKNDLYFIILYNFHLFY